MPILCPFIIMQEERPELHKERAPYRLPGSFQEEPRHQQRRSHQHHQNGGREKRRRSGNDHANLLARLRRSNSRATKRHFQAPSIHGKRRTRNERRVRNRIMNVSRSQSESPFFAPSAPRRLAATPTASEIAGFKAKAGGDFEVPREANEMLKEMHLMGGHASGYLNDNGEFVMDEDEDDFEFDDDELNKVNEVTSQSAQEKQIRSQQVYIEALEDSNLKLQERCWILEQQLLAAQSDRKQGDSEDESHGRGAGGRSPSESDGERIMALGGQVPLRGSKAMELGLGNGSQNKGGIGDEESIQASAA